MCSFNLRRLLAEKNVPSVASWASAVVRFSVSLSLQARIESASMELLTLVQAMAKYTGPENRF